MKSIACYVYAGNFSLGVMSVPGCKVLAHCEDPKPYGDEVLRLNPKYFGKVKVHPYQADANIPWPVYKDLDLIFANPPCAAFSNANTVSFNKDSWKDDPRVACWWNVIKHIQRCQPTMFAIESVCQMYSKAPDHICKITRWAKQNGYRPHLFFHNTCFMGSAQDRKRLLFIGTRHELVEANYLSKPALTVGQALKGVRRGEWEPAVEDRLKEVVKAALPGEDLRRAWNRLHPEGKRKLNERGQVAGRPSFGLRRYRMDAPSLVVMGYPIVHPSEDRYFSLAEHKALADFPRDYKFPQKSGCFDYVGRGVSSKVGTWLAKTCKLTLSKKKPLKGDTRLRIINGLTGMEEEDVGVIDNTNYLPVLSLSVRPTTTLRRAGTPKKVVNRSDNQKQRKELTPPKIIPAGQVTEPDVKLGSGLYIRYLLTIGTTDVNAILKLVHKRFPQSKAGPSDVYWNRRKLEKDGGYFEPGKPRQKTITRPTPVKKKPAKEKKPRQVRAAHPEPDREFDQSQLRIGSHGRYLHRDYSAHFFRWSFAKRFMRGNGKILDVGCGQELPLMHLLLDGRLVKQNVPELYVGVDLNKVKKPARSKVMIFDEFNFVRRHKELRQHGPFDYAVCCEVIEHMTADNGRKMLRAISHLVKDGGHLILSTPVFEPRIGAARNHVHEYTVPELDKVLHKTGFNVLKRFGTFMGINMIKKMEPVHRRIADELKAYYDNDALACFLAPIYPDLARNNLWVCEVR